MQRKLTNQPGGSKLKNKNPITFYNESMCLSVGIENKTELQTKEFHREINIGLVCESAEEPGVVHRCAILPPVLSFTPVSLAPSAGDPCPPAEAAGCEARRVGRRQLDAVVVCTNCTTMTSRADYADYERSNLSVTGWPVAIANSNNGEGPTRRHLLAKPTTSNN